MSKLYNKIIGIPIIGPFIKRTKRLLKGEKKFSSSKAYWEERYSEGGNSGAGSYNKLATFKAEVINSYIDKYNLQSAIEFGCGDGHQLALINIENYLGFDVSKTAIENCKSQYKSDPSKKFKLLSSFQGEQADLTLSLDVIYHLIEDDVFEDHLNKLFQASNKFIIIYSSNQDGNINNNTASHVKHRKFTDWISANKPEFTFIEKIPNRYPFDGDGKNTSYADFYIYKNSN